MIAGFEYKHYKGGTYEVLGIALPYHYKTIEMFGMGEPYCVYDALTPEHMDIIKMNVWEKGSVMICDTELPQVIYRAYEDFDDERGREYGETWARTVNNFFDYVPLSEDDEVVMTKRFTLVSSKKAHS